MDRKDLKPIELENNLGPDVNGVIHRVPWKAYDIEEADAVMDGYEAEIKKLKEDYEAVMHSALVHSDLNDKYEARIKELEQTHNLDECPLRNENRELKKRIEELEANEQFLNDAHCKLLDKLDEKEKRINDLEEKIISSDKVVAEISSENNKLKEANSSIRHRWIECLKIIGTIKEALEPTTKEDKQ